MLRYQLHVVTLFLAAVIAVLDAHAEPQCANNRCHWPTRIDRFNSSQVASLVRVKRFARDNQFSTQTAHDTSATRFLEVNVHSITSSTNASYRSMRNANGLFIRTNRLKIDSTVSVVPSEKCDPPSSCELETPSLAQLCRDKSDSLPKELCKLPNSSRKFRDETWQYGQFFHNIMAIFGKQSRRYMCINKESAFYTSEELSDKCLFVFFQASNCTSCNSKTGKCGQLPGIFLHNLYLISSFSLPDQLHPKNRTDKIIHGLECRITKFKSHETVTINGLPRWFLTSSGGVIKRGNESDPFDIGSHWSGKHRQSNPAPIMETTTRGKTASNAVVTRNSTARLKQRTKTATVVKTTSTTTKTSTTTTATTTASTTTTPPTTTASATKNTALASGGSSRKTTRKDRNINPIIPSFVAVNVSDNNERSFFDAIRNMIPPAANHVSVNRQNITALNSERKMKRKPI